MTVTIEGSEIKFARKRQSTASPPVLPFSGTKEMSRELVSEENERLGEEDMERLLGQVLESARKDGRVVFGLQECSKALHRKSAGTLLCVLPCDISENSDATFRICLTLMEAYCLENEVLQIRVESSDKLLQIANGYHEFQSNTAACLLVQKPRKNRPVENSSFSEEEIVDLLRSQAHQGKILPLRVSVPSK